MIFWYSCWAISYGKTLTAASAPDLCTATNINENSNSSVKRQFHVFKSKCNQYRYSSTRGSAAITPTTSNSLRTDRCSQRINLKLLYVVFINLENGVRLTNFERREKESENDRERRENDPHVNAIFSSNLVNRLLALHFVRTSQRTYCTSSTSFTSMRLNKEHVSSANLFEPACARFQMVLISEGSSYLVNFYGVKYFL